MAEILPPQVEPSRSSSQFLQPDGEGDERFFRPMLSASLPSAQSRVPTQEEVIADLKKLDWSRGFLSSPKIDGIRAVKSPVELVSRSLTPIPNRWIQKGLHSQTYNGLDGELIIGTVSEFLNFNSSQSGIMSQAGEPFFTWCVFDDVTHPNNAFWWRHQQAQERVEAIKTGHDFHGLMDLYFVVHKLVHSVEELLEYEEEQLALGFEGIMFRDPGGRYKSFPSNRSTFKQQGLIKLKRFVDAEAVVTGFVEKQLNNNPQERNKLGYAKRSSALSGQVGGDTLGKLEVTGINGRFKDVEFAIGSGIDHTLQRRIWGDRESYLGKIVKYKFQDAGAKDAPRSPIFLGFRDEGDM